MRIEVIEAVRAVLVVGLCGIVFGSAWAFTAPHEWGFYGVPVALFGFLAVCAAAAGRLFVVGEDRLSRWW